jgi:hypothetical protein
MLAHSNICVLYQDVAWRQHPAVLSAGCYPGTKIGSQSARDIRTAKGNGDGLQQRRLSCPLKIDPMRRVDSAKIVQALRGIGAQIAEVDHPHKKVIVIDDHTVMMGSLNAMSHHDTREVMITTRGAHFARRLLADLHAEEFTAVPRCGACGGDGVDLRRGTKGYYWRCYSKTCPHLGKGRFRGWTQPVILKRSR